ALLVSRNGCDVCTATSVGLGLLLLPVCAVGAADAGAAVSAAAVGTSVWAAGAGASVWAAERTAVAEPVVADGLTAGGSIVVPDPAQAAPIAARPTTANRLLTVRLSASSDATDSFPHSRPCQMSGR